MHRPGHKAPLVNAEPVEDLIGPVFCVPHLRPFGVGFQGS